jgi:hypothetical protein
MQGLVPEPLSRTAGEGAEPRIVVRGEADEGTEVVTFMSDGARSIHSAASGLLAGHCQIEGGPQPAASRSRVVHPR